MKGIAICSELSRKAFVLNTKKSKLNKLTERGFTMELVFISKKGVKFKLFGKRKWDSWTAPKEFWDCWHSTTLEF